MQKRKKLKVLGVIPARMASSRFPGKPLAKINGIPMVGHVYFRSCMSRCLTEVCVATCDQEIMDYTASIGGKAVMTSDKHERASDRAAEALVKMEKECKTKFDIVVMIQGDEPMLVPEMIDLAVAPLLKDKTTLITNLLGAIRTKEEFEDPNVVKTVVDRRNFAMYFSREPVPSRKKFSGDYAKYKQVPVIPFRRDFLIKFNQLTPTPMEIVESVDMLRVLEHGYPVKMVPSKFETYSVDTPQDLATVEHLMTSDPWCGKYPR